MLKYIMFVILGVFVTTSVSQSLPSLTRLQMYSDFDTLTKILLEVSPHTPVREKVTGLNLNLELTRLRLQIEQVNSTVEFGSLVRTAITLCQDGHTNLLWNGYNNTLQEYLDEGISKEAVDVLPLYDSLLRKSFSKPFNLRLKYINGDYYSIGEFTYKDQLFQAGIKLLNCNGKDIHEYVGGLPGSVSMMRWDFERKRYFSETFYKGSHLKKTDSILLTFTDNNGSLISTSFGLSDTLNYFKNVSNAASDTFKTVEYFPEEQILYIRVPKMALEYSNYYSGMIRKQGGNKPLKKVIIDIRNNPGGSDNVWTTILKSLISEPLTYENLLLCNNSPTIKSKLIGPEKNMEPFPVSFLDNYEYAIYSISNATLVPDSTTIGFKGNIYVIQNENIYSSAGSFTAVAILAQNLITVGSPTGKLLGRGINPLSFELPYSKILFRVEPVIDFLNVKNAEDVFHDKVEIPVELTVSQYVDRLTSTELLYSKDYLINRDPVFKKILEIK